MVTLRIRSIIWFATGAVVALIVTLLVTQAWTADAAPGDTDSTFVPVTPCRLFDTRPGELPDTGKKTPLTAGDGAALVQQVTGSIGNCVGIPAGTKAVAMNITIANPTAQSNLRIFPANAATPLVSNLNWLPGQSPTPNKVDVKLSGNGKIKLVNFNGTVDVIGDVVGYYTNSTLEELATRVASLEAAEPFAVSSHIPNDIALDLDPKSVLSVPVTAPVDGQVTVSYSIYINNSSAGQSSVCAPYRSAEIPSATIAASARGLGWWESAGSDGNQGTVSGITTFDITAGTTTTYSLACEKRGGTGVALSRSMTAIFTPTP